MQALVKRDPGPGMSIEELPTPEPEPGEVRLRSKAVGIDGGTEALIYDWHEKYHGIESELPAVYGHEFGGVVDAVGESVSGWSVGDRVAAEPGVTCGECRNCLRGEPNLCERRRLVGEPGGGMDGALAEYVTVPAENLYSIGEDISFDEAAFLEVLALGVNAVEYSQLELGDDVAITGPGPVGVAVLIACAASGAGSVAVAGAPADAERRLPIAGELGATRTFDVESGSFEGDVDVFFEAAGARSAVDAAVANTRRGGQIVQIGNFADGGPVPIDVNALQRNGVDYRTVRARRHSSWRKAIGLARRVDLSPAIGPSFDLEDHEAAFEAYRNREGVKITLRP